MIHTYTIEGIPLLTGDLICTMDGAADILPGQFWRLLGRLVPGDADHIVIYVGPDGQCVESGALGVIQFNVENGRWDAKQMIRKRGLLVDTFLGVAYPLESAGLTLEEQVRSREDIAAYCLAQVGKPYNLNFFNPETENAFYCSQLAYKAYQRHQVNLNTGLAVPDIPGTEQIIFPQEVWAGFPHRHASA